MSKNFVAVRDLPASLKSALSDLGYARKDVAIEAAPTAAFVSAYGEGYRAFAMALNLETGESTTLYGNWGGESINGARQVDADRREHTIPLNGCLILGQEGGGRPVSASVIVNPANVAQLLPAIDISVTERDRHILNIFGGYKSFARPQYLDQAGVTDAEIDSLIARGLLSRNKAGATAITTAGKNSRGNKRVF